MFNAYTFPPAAAAYCAPCGLQVAADMLSALNADDSARDTAEAVNGVVNEQGLFNV